MTGINYIDFYTRPFWLGQTNFGSQSWSAWIILDSDQNFHYSTLIMTATYIAIDCNLKPQNTFLQNAHYKLTVCVTLDFLGLLHHTTVNKMNVIVTLI